MIHYSSIIIYGVILLAKPFVTRVLHTGHSNDTNDSMLERRKKILLENFLCNANKKEHTDKEYSLKKFN